MGGMGLGLQLRVTGLGRRFGRLRHLSAVRNLILSFLHAIHVPFTALSCVPLTLNQVHKSSYATCGRTLNLACPRIPTATHEHMLVSH